MLYAIKKVTMIKKLLLVLTILTLFSCGDENDDIYKTKSEEFASKKGNFIADFPTKPYYSSIDNQIGLDKFQTHLIRSTLGENKVFSIEYIDYPQYMIKSTSDEQLFAQIVTNFTNKMADSFDLDFQKPIEQHGLKGQYFVLKLNQYAISKGIIGHIEGKIFRNGNRVFTVTYLGRYDKNTDPFMSSFRLLK